MTAGFKDLSWSLGSRVASTVFAVAVQSCLAWFLGPEGRGAYAVCLVFASLIGIVFELGTDTAGAYMVASGRLSLSKGLIACMLLAGGMGIAGMGAGALLLQLPLEYFTKADMSSFWISLLMIPLLLIYQSMMRLMTAIKRFDAYALFAFVYSFVSLASVVLLVHVMGWGVNGALWAQVISWATVALLMFAHLPCQPASPQKNGRHS